MWTVGLERSQPIEIDAGSTVWTFSANGEYLMGGDKCRIRVWRVKDGEQVASMYTGIVKCLAVSNDGRWIAAGTEKHDACVWDATTYKQVWKHSGDDSYGCIDFSPDSTRLVAATKGKAVVGDAATGKQEQTLNHVYCVIAAKYSPQGDRIATATGHSVHVWDGNDGRLLVDINVNVTSRYNTGLLWLNDHLLVASDNRIKEFNASTKSLISEWPVPSGNSYSSIALPSNKEFIAYSTERTVAFLDTSTHSQLALIHCPQDVRSIAFSPDDRFLAIGGWDGKISIERLSRIIVSGFSLDHDILEQLCSSFGVKSNPVVPSAPHPSGTCYPQRRRCSRLVETRPAGKR